MRLFTTLVRFDAVYHGHFKCNRNKLTEMPHLWGYARDLFQTPGFGDEVDFDQIKQHYYVVHTDINPTADRARRARRVRLADAARPRLTPGGRRHGAQSHASALTSRQPRKFAQDLLISHAFAARPPLRVRGPVVAAARTPGAPTGPRLHPGGADTPTCPPAPARRAGAPLPGSSAGPRGEAPFRQPVRSSQGP